MKYFIDVGAGVIDSDYRGEVLVLLFNFGDQLFEGFFCFKLFIIKILKINLVKKGDRIAQLIIEQICNPELQIVEVRF